jgi:excisionase family DNA binding protein
MSTIFALHMKQYQHLKTVQNFATMLDVTRSYVYRMIREQKIKAVEIDGVLFIDTTKVKSLKQG